jgi:hypothetical protein
MQEHQHVWRWVEVAGVGLWVCRCDCVCVLLGGRWITLQVPIGDEYCWIHETGGWCCPECFLFRELVP